MADTATLEIELLDFWHCGSGRGSNDFLDAVAGRDAAGLPFVPGRLLKGLLRDAVARYEAFGHAAVGSTEALFGTRHAAPEAPRLPGRIRVGDARLPEVLRAWLRAPGGAAYRQALARELFAATVDDTGKPRESGPRGLEVIVPVVLEAELLAIGDAPDGWRGLLAAALPLAGAVGAHRTRGLGRCAMRLPQEPNPWIA